MRRHTQPGHMIYDTAWMVSVSMVTCFLQIALTMSSVAMVADENMYAGLFFMRNIKNWIISVSMVTSEYRRGKRALYFAIDPCLYLKEHDNTTRKKQKGRGGGAMIKWIKCGHNSESWFCNKWAVRRWREINKSELMSFSF